MSNAQSLIELFYKHHLWSNLRLFDACLTLDTNQLNHTDPGAYGSILATLTHLVQAEERYLFFLTRKESITPPNGQTSIVELRSRCQISSTLLAEVTASMQPDQRVQVGDGEDAEFLPANIILLQAIHHAHEHRTQVATLLGQLGIEPPRLSGWSYYDEQVAPK